MEFTPNIYIDNNIIHDICTYNTLDEYYLIKAQKYYYTVEYFNIYLEEILQKEYNCGDFIIIDSNVQKYYINIDKSNISKSPYTYYIFNANEENKTMSSVLDIIDKMGNFTKKNKIIVIGGGITQDVGGFAAAIYKRGVDWILIPTTLLAITDSCIGGKVGVNHGSKNMVGLFSAPKKVIISDKFLDTLDHDMIMSGLGEALKLALIGGESTYNYFKLNMLSKNYNNIIKMGIVVKKIIIEKDEFEKYERKVLNYGHTIGHALEATTNYLIPHGIAVLIGMYLINNIFDNELDIDINYTIYNLIDKKYLQINIDKQNLVKHILNDKKNDGDNICFIVLKSLGKTEITYHNILTIKYKLYLAINNLFKK